MANVAVATSNKLASVNDLHVIGEICVEGFLTDFSEFHYKCNPYVEQIVSNWVKMSVWIDGNRAQIFTYFDSMIDTEFEDVDEEDVKLGFIRKCEENPEVYIREEMVHWSFRVDYANSNSNKHVFYVHYEDWACLYGYLSMMREDSQDLEYVKFEIADGWMVFDFGEDAEEFRIRLYD